MSICDGDKEQKLKIIRIFQVQGHSSALHYSTGLKFELNLSIFVTKLCTKFYLKIPMTPMYDRDNEWKLNTEGLND